MELVKQIYSLASQLPSEEKFALSDQMRRAAISIPSNIAEGYERSSKKEYVHFLSIANGSKAELYTQVQICKILGYVVDTTEIDCLISEIGKMLKSMIKKLGA